MLCAIGSDRMADCPGDGGREVRVFESLRSCVVVLGRQVLSLGPNERQTFDVGGNQSAEKGCAGK